MPKYQVVCWSADTWEVEAPDIETAVALAEDGQAEHVSGSFCDEPDVYDEDGNHVQIGGSAS